MLRKLSFLMIIAMLLTACGASAPEENAMDAVVEASSISETSLSEQGSGETETVSAGAPMEDVQESPELCAAEYFLFAPVTNTVTDEAGQTLLYEHQTVPSFTSAVEARSEWVGEVLSSIDRYYHADSSNLETYARDFISQNGSEGFYSYSNYQQLGVARHDEKVVSLLALSSLNSGGSHPNSVQTAYNLDIDNRKILKLEDVILESGAEELGRLVRAGVDEKFIMIDGGNGLFEDYGLTIDNSTAYGNMTPYWYLNETGLVIFYNQYELGPYAAGIIKVELPYAKLGNILKPEFLPPEHTDVTGDLVLIDNPGQLHRIPITIEKEGERLLVGVEGTVYQVQLSEVLWLEDIPIAQQVLFSAKSLCSNDVLEITGGYTDESRSFAIEFHNGRGEGQILYIHDGELSAEP